MTCLDASSPFISCLVLFDFPFIFDRHGYVSHSTCYPLFLGTHLLGSILFLFMLFAECYWLVFNHCISC